MLPPAEEIQFILERGEAAREMLGNPAFLAVLDDLSTFHLSALVSAAPGERDRETRDHHHTMHTAIREIAGEVQSRAAAADELLARLAAEEDTE